MTIIDRITAWLVKKEIIPPTEIPTTAPSTPPEWVQKAADEQQKVIGAYNLQSLQALDADKAAGETITMKRSNYNGAVELWTRDSMALKARDMTISKLRETIADGMAVQQSQAAEITSLKRALAQAKARNKTLARKAGAK